MSQPTTTTVRAFSTSPVSAAEGLSQLEPLQTTEEIPSTAEANKTAAKKDYNFNDMKEFLLEVKLSQGSDKALQMLEANILSLQARIAQIVYEKGKVTTIQPLEHIAYAGDVAITNMHLKRAKQSERAAAKTTKYLKLLESILERYQNQVAAIKELSKRRAMLRKQKEEALQKKRALLKQLEEQKEAKRKAQMVVRVTQEKRKREDYNFERGKESYKLDDILNEALEKVKKAKKEPSHPPKPVKDARDRDVMRRDRVMRPAGSGAHFVLGRNRPGRSSEEDALADPIMDEEQVTTAPGESNETLGVAREEIDGTVVSRAVPNEAVVDAFSKPPERDAFGLLPSSPSSSLASLPSERLRTVVPPSGFIPIDEDLIVSFDAPVPQLQKDVLALRDRLKSSYPRIDVLPYDVWTSKNKRTLQTWLKILVTKWNARFEHVDSTRQMAKETVDERVRAVLDQMVRDHDLSNDAAERMAMRWHDVFDGKFSLDSDAEGRLDLQEMEAEGLGFLIDDPGDELLQQQKLDVEAVSQTQHGVHQTMRGDFSSSTTSSLVGRRMYSTSSRRTILSGSEVEFKTGSIDKADETDKLDQRQPQASRPQPANPQPHLPHLTASGSAHMVSVSNKQHTTRTAIAVGTVYFTNPTPLQLIRSNSLKKGDVLGTSRIAGIMAAKKCPEIIPLCHPIALTHVGVELRAFGSNAGDTSPDSLPSTPTSQYTTDPGYGGIQIEAKVQCTGPTGVEMEALTAVMGAALSVVDMCKAVDKFQRVQDVRVVLKEGGKSGVWREEGWESWQD